MIKKIYFAGGCFWGVQGYFDKIKGVVNTSVGYAQGTTVNPNYQQVCSGTTNHTETVEVEYDSTLINLNELLELYFKVINPTLLNRQGNDIGTQYRTGVYFTEAEDHQIIKQFLDNKQANYSDPIVVENQELKNYYLAEEYHQKYLEKNPTGYCHINLNNLTGKHFK